MIDNNSLKSGIYSRQTMPDTYNINIITHN